MPMLKLILFHTATERISEAHFGAPSSASLASLLYLPYHWTKIPCELHAVAVIMRHLRHSQRTMPTGTGRSRQWRHGKHHRWHTELLRECTQVWSTQSNEQRTLTNCSNISQGFAWCTGLSSNSAQVSRSIVFTKQFSSLTNSIYDTTWNTFVADLQVLRSRLGCRDVRKMNWTK